MRTRLICLLLCLLGCGGGDNTPGFSLDAGIDATIDSRNDMGLDDALTQTYDHLTPPAYDANDCLGGQTLYCKDSPGIIIASCGVICTVIPSKVHTVFGPACFTCADPADIYECGWICFFPPDSGWQ